MSNLCQIILVVGLCFCWHVYPTSADVETGREKHGHLFPGQPPAALWFAQHAVDPELKTAAVDGLKDWLAQNSKTIDPASHGLVMGEISRLEGDPESARRQIKLALESIGRDGETVADVNVLDMVLSSSAAWGHLGEPELSQALRRVTNDWLPFSKVHRDDWMTLLRRAYLRGDYSLVIEVADDWRDKSDDVLQDPGLALLAARSHGYRFWEYFDTRRSRRNESPSQFASELKSRATETTHAYEIAMELEQDPHVKMQIYREWWGYNAHRAFEADSEAIRSAVHWLWTQDPEIVSDRARHQADELAGAFAKAFSDSSEGESDSDQAMELIRSEYLMLAPMGVSEDRFDKIVKGASDFVSHGFPAELAGPNGLALSLRWYLWGCVAYPEPSRESRELIEAQHETLKVWMQDAFDEALANPMLHGLGRREAATYADWYARTKDNPWFPYFKQPLQPHEWEKIRLANINEINQIGRPMRLKWASVKPGQADVEEYAQDERRHTYALRVSIQRWVTNYCRPMFRWHLPTKRITECSGMMNDSNAYIFSVDDWKVMPEGAPKPYLTTLRQR